MNEYKKELLIQNMKDAGCTCEDISDVLNLIESEQVSEGIIRLRQYRCGLMNELHEQQKRVDCLDYLIMKLGGK